jgi:hypothetical protein
VLDSAGKIFTWQHDPEPLGNGVYTFFDNESAGTANTGSGALTELPYSRVVTVRLNFRTHVATLLRAADQPETLSAPSQGNGQTLRNGDLVAGWGLSALLLRVQPVRLAAVQRRVPGRGEQLPRLPVRLEPGPPLTTSSS